MVALQTKPVDPDLVRLGPSLSLDQIKAEGPSFTRQEMATLETTTSSAFQAASWLDLWPTAVPKISSTSVGNIH